MHFPINVLARDCTLRIEKAEWELGYKPVVTFEEGIAQLHQAMA